MATPVAEGAPGHHLVTDVIEHLATTFAEERGCLEERWSRGNIVVGVIGVLIGGFMLGAFITDRVLAPLGIAGGSPVALVIVAFIGAVILLALLRLFAGSGVGGRRWDRRRSHARGVNARRFFGRRYVGPRGRQEVDPEQRRGPNHPRPLCQRSSWLTNHRGLAT